MSQPETSAATEPSPAEGAAHPPWTLVDVLICLVGGVIAGFVPILPFGWIMGAIGARPPDSVFYLIGGSSIYLMVGFFIWLVIVRRRKVPIESLGLRWVGWTALVLMLPATIVLMIVSGIVAQLTGMFINDVPDAQDQLAVGSGGMSFGDFLAILIVVAVIGPIVEELVFRGLLHPYIRARKGVAAGLLLSSLAFSVIHFIPQLLLVFFVMGFIYGWVAEYLKSLYPAILLHSLNNAVSTWAVYSVLN